MPPNPMSQPPWLPRFPPLLNSASPWATTKKDLQELFNCLHNGGVTTRTALLQGFNHDPSIHEYTFFSTDTHAAIAIHPEEWKAEDDITADEPSNPGGSLNTLGYSPINLDQYLDMIRNVIEDSDLPEATRTTKPWIVSVTGSAEDVTECYRKIRHTQTLVTNPISMEINLSCPNIPGKPPPAYSGLALAPYLELLTREKSAADPQIAVGIKTPPYTYHDQYKTLIDALLVSCTPGCPVDFITATNTLGSSLVLADKDGTPAIGSASGLGIGGMGGAPLHALALGNVKTLRTMLDGHDGLRKIKIIGVGGVSDTPGFLRMLAVGADTVEVGTALGMQGASVFINIIGNTNM